MAAAGAVEHVLAEANGTRYKTNGVDDPFLAGEQHFDQPYLHRYSSRFDLDYADLGTNSSPSQVKRILEAHLLETERRLQDTHKLGTSLLEQQSELQDKLHEVEQQQDDAEISPELKQRLASIGREHDDVSREIARSLLAPKSRAVSGEEMPNGDTTTFTSQATGSPTKISAPSRRQRNQPPNRAGDLQFAADISTSLLAQVRQLQAAVAERDEALKTVTFDRSKLEQDVQLFVQKLRSHDEHEQRYKDENWNLEAQNHELLSAQREAVDREKRLNAAISVAIVEKARLLSEIEETRLAHHKATEDHDVSKKAHESEIHSLKRDFDAADSERSNLQSRIDELTGQNQELARAMASRFRDQSPQKQPDFDIDDESLSRNLSTPEQSPPPSPTKATPRHGGLESETLKSSLQHAHRMIQNLKSNIHREKTEKIELKRMLQDARDELENLRNESGFGSGSKKQKLRNESFKKPLRPDMLGGSRRARTDVELQEDGWEDQLHDIPGTSGVSQLAPAAGLTDLSDAYQTAHETESNFDTADERLNTESEAFETGAESLAGDSSDDLTETESTAPRSLRQGSLRPNRPSLAFRSAGARNSYLSTASTSAGEEDDDELMQTPVQNLPHRFKLRNGRSPSVRQTQIFEGTPESVRTQLSAQDSPATLTDGRSPPAVEQSLYAELEGIDDNSSTFSTPARSGVLSVGSTPGVSQTPSRAVTSITSEVLPPKAVMVDSSTMTETWTPKSIGVPTVAGVQQESAKDHLRVQPDTANTDRGVSIGDFPLPPGVSGTPVEHIDAATQYTPQKSIKPETPETLQQPYEQNSQYTPTRVLQDSPIRGANAFITPPKTVWDTEHDSEIGSPERSLTAANIIHKPSLGYSGMLIQDTTPMSPARDTPQVPAILAYSTILSQQTYPITPPPSRPPKGPLPAIPSLGKQSRDAANGSATGLATGGLLAGAAAALGLSWAKDKDASSKTRDDELDDRTTTSMPHTRAPLQDVSGNVQPMISSLTKIGPHEQNLPITASNNVHNSPIVITEAGGQTHQEKKTAGLGLVRVPTATKMASEVQSPSTPRSPELSKKSSFTGSSAPTSPPLRPSSASSHRVSTSNKQHPPLPSDYKTNIERANSLVHSGSVRKESNKAIVGSVMGPPLVPASAMRRPKTPSDSTRSPTRENATPRVSHGNRQRGNTESQLSRRSSMSSFVSEVDERFGMRAGAAGNGYDSAPDTDPRMIQAITQTMIGEYLWKYTRRAGGKEMSNTRHKRYFWVHPYTKTLYWSTTDPSLPGAKEGKSRSVPIESIRVVADENPMPPGLHRKSLEVTTPSRKLKFTAATSQRHDTWFNALSYLLLRGEPPHTHGAYSTGGNEITRDDIEEFRASAYDPHLVPTSRQSMSSYNSRTTTGTSKRVSNAAGTGMRQSLPSNVVSTNNGTLRHQDSVSRTGPVPAASTSGRVSRADSSREADKDRTVRAASLSRVSRMLGSITGRSSRQAIHEQDERQQAGQSRGPSRQSNSIYDASVMTPSRDSAEETRQEMLKQEPQGAGSGGLENVRACCDGKHDVSTLSHQHRPVERNRTLSSMSDRINRSVSKRT